MKLKNNIFKKNSLFLSSSKFKYTILFTLSMLIIGIMTLLVFGIIKSSQIIDNNVNSSQINLKLEINF